MESDGTPKDHKDPELDAMVKVYAALKDLEPEAQYRVLDYIAGRLNLTRLRQNIDTQQGPDETRRFDASDIEADLADTSGSRHDVNRGSTNATPHNDETHADDELQGISPVAQKWMRRASLSATQLSSIFSLGVDEIDVVAKSVPGKNAKQRFRNVILLQGIASYLGSGTPKFEHKKLREAYTHYDADPAGNLTTYIKDLASDVSGSAAAGYTLTSRGLNSATDLVKQMTGGKSDKTQS